MTTAAPEATTTATTAQEPVARTFVARGRSERLVRKPILQKPDGFGGWVTYDTGRRFDFDPDGRIVAYDGRDIRSDDHPAQLVSDAELAERGLPLQGQPRDEVQWLRGHPGFGIRFWEEGNEPDRPRPLEEDFMAACGAAATDLDEERLEELIETEQATHGRAHLIRGAEAILGQVRETKAGVEAEPVSEIPTQPVPVPPEQRPPGY